MIASLTTAVTALAITAMLCLAFTRAWRGWLDLRRLELVRDADRDGREPEAGLRIELAAVRERLRRLEAIASGVEL